MSSGFVSENELAEQRRLRQEEWERVRTADQPLARPEEPYDSRCLFDRLQEQKNKKDAEYEEAHKLKNMIKGLDDDEVEFLDLVDRTKLEEERKKNLEEQKEMRDFKAAVASLQEKSLEERLKQELKAPRNFSKDISRESGSRSSQPKLLAGVVVKKSGKQGSESRGVKRKISTEETDVAREGKTTKVSPETTGCSKSVGILPGLGSYDDTSDSENTSSSDDETEGSKKGQSNALEPKIKSFNEHVNS